MCNYQAGAIMCRGDGYCWDADNDGYDPDDHSWPCPSCNTEIYLHDAKEEAESTTSYGSISGSGTGVTIWEAAVVTARISNPEMTETILVKIGQVDAYSPVGVWDQSSVLLSLYVGQERFARVI